MSENVFAGKGAVVFGSLLVGGFLVISCFAVLDDRGRGELEVLRETSAVGDAVVVVVPEAESAEAEAWTQKVLATVEGRGFYPGDSVKRPDGAMAKAGVSEEGIPVYRRLRSGVLQKAFYVKLAPGRFLELSETPEKSRGKKEKREKSAIAAP